jgi:hypothetical protein
VTNRVVDYCGFAVRFVGLGYLALWPLARPDPFDLARFCRPDALPWRFLCHWPQLISLTPGLNLIGIFCAGTLGIQLALQQAARWRRVRALRAGASLALAARVPAARAGPPRRSPFAAPPRKVKPRSHFGLRPGPREPRGSGVISAVSKPTTQVEQS